MCSTCSKLTSKTSVLTFHIYLSAWIAPLIFSDFLHEVKYKSDRSGFFVENFFLEIQQNWPKIDIFTIFAKLYFVANLKKMRVSDFRSLLRPFNYLVKSLFLISWPIRLEYCLISYNSCSSGWSFSIFGWFKVKKEKCRIVLWYAQCVN